MGYSGSLLGGIILLGLGFFFCSSVWGGLLVYSDLVNLGGLWLFIYLCNNVGLVPYSWAFTINGVSNLFIMVLMWFSLSFYSSASGSMVWFTRSVSHLLPTGTPLFLWLILPMIELVSQFLRPLTLTLRLSANLVAGHVLIFLAGQLGFLVGGLSYLILVPFEMMVALVQSAVVYLLLVSYFSEV